MLTPLVRYLQITYGTCFNLYMYFIVHIVLLKSQAIRRITTNSNCVCKMSNIAAWVSSWTGHRGKKTTNCPRSNIHGESHCAMFVSEIRACSFHDMHLAATCSKLVVVDSLQGYLTTFVYLLKLLKICPSHVFCVFLRECWYCNKLLLITQNNVSKSVDTNGPLFLLQKRSVAKDIMFQLWFRQITVRRWLIDLTSFPNLMVEWTVKNCKSNWTLIFFDCAKIT